ncbi:Pre-rRNA-processing protein ESF1 [Pelomyxa schiedti]|nr:Pre-rRNA-processing protein ESF1 [Pelomyxa schiedti]
MSATLGATSASQCVTIIDRHLADSSAAPNAAAWVTNLACHNAGRIRELCGGKEPKDTPREELLLVLDQLVAQIEAPNVSASRRRPCQKLYYHLLLGIDETQVFDYVRLMEAITARIVDILLQMCRDFIPQEDHALFKQIHPVPVIPFNEPWSAQIDIAFEGGGEVLDTTANYKPTNTSPSSPSTSASTTTTATPSTSTTTPSTPGAEGGRRGGGGARGRGGGRGRGRGRGGQRYAGATGANWWEKPPANDSRFAIESRDGRFKAPPSTLGKIAIDPRFQSALSLDTSTPREFEPSIDEFGRPIAIAEALEVKPYQKAMKDYYYVEGGGNSKPTKKDATAEEHEKEEESEGEDKEARNNESGEQEKESESESEEEEEEEKESEKTAAAEGEAGSKVSEPESEEEAEETESLEEKVSDSEPEEAIPTSRLAVVNLDFTSVSATDLFVVLSSFIPSEVGTILKVTVYPSNYGLKMMEEERVHGPPQSLFEANPERDESDEDEESDSSDDDAESKTSNNANDSDASDVPNVSDLEEVEEDSDDEPKDPDVDERIDYNLDWQSRKGLGKAKSANSGVNMNYLRAYEEARLRYYYAVVECSNVETAKALFGSEANGMQLEWLPAGLVELQYIPEDQTFTNQPRDEASSIPPNYQRPHFKQYTTLSWDEDMERRKILKSNWMTILRNHDFDRKALEAQQFLASDSSSDEGEEATPESKEKKQKEKINKLRSAYKELVGKYDDAPVLTKVPTGSATDSKDSSAESSDLVEEESGNKEATFKLGLEEVGQRLVDKRKTQSQKLTVWETYLQKRAERRKKMAELKDHRKKEGASLHENLADENQRSRAQLELLLMPESTQDDEGKDEVKDKERGKKPGSLGEEVSSSSDEDSSAMRAMGVSKRKKAFELDTEDPRFRSLFTSKDFAPDPTNPQFAKSKSITQILQIRAKNLFSEDHQAIKNVESSGPTLAPSLSDLAASVKRKQTVQQVSQPQGMPQQQTPKTFSALLSSMEKPVEEPQVDSSSTRKRPPPSSSSTNPHPQKAIRTVPMKKP